MKTPCKECQSVRRIFFIKLIPTNRAEGPHFPKYVPQVTEKCLDCGQWIRFSPQSPELIQQFNQVISSDFVTDPEYEEDTNATK